MKPLPDFYTGAPLEPEDLWFREDFIERLWEVLATQHLVLSAPRRMGKTSVMDALAARPRDGFETIPVFVQDINHPADYLFLSLDLFHERHPRLFRDLFHGAAGWIGKALEKVGEVGAGGFKVKLRENDPDWRHHWKAYGDEFFHEVRRHPNRLLLLVDEFPDMLLNMQKDHPELVRPFLTWFRGHRLDPRPPQDRIRWLICGSVNLHSTLDALGCLDTINDFHDEPLPVLTPAEVKQFVREMLAGRQVPFAAQVPARVAAELGRPVPVFLQMATQDLYRQWKKHGTKLTARDVQSAFADLIISSGARDKLQHFHSRIDRYYQTPKREAAYSILAKLSLSKGGLRRAKLFADFERILLERGDTLVAEDRKRLFNHLMRDLENDFYVAEIRPGVFDFASGLLKKWWKKYYA